MDIGQLSPLGLIIVVIGLVSAIITIIAFVFKIDAIKGKSAVVTVILLFVGCFIFVRIFSSGNQSTPTSTSPTATSTHSESGTQTATPSPTPTQITITKNLVIPCISNCAIALKLTTIVIDTTTQTSTWNFTLFNTTDPIDNAKFSTLELEDNTTQKHPGAGPAKTDTWNMGSGQSIHTSATFDMVQGTNSLLNLAIDYNTWYTVTYQTEPITF